MKISRRKFLRSGTSAAALGAGALMFPKMAAGQLGALEGRFTGSDHLGGWDSFNKIADFNKSDFEGLLGTQFNLLSETYGHRTVTLTGVTAAVARKGNRTQTFSLVFKGQDWEDVNQDVYYVSHDSLGYFYALMAPVRESRKSNKLCYEAVINRLI
jgi:hypothetical protein